MSKFLNQHGVQHLVEKVKDGTIVSGKTLEVVAGGKVPASTITGVIDISNIPNGALERLVKVANKAARLKLTANDIQLGDTVQELDTGLMFIVVDQTKLNSDDGYQEYTAGKATKAASADSVEWGGVKNVPTNISQLGSYKDNGKDAIGSPAQILSDALIYVSDGGQGNAVTSIERSKEPNETPHTLQISKDFFAKSISIYESSNKKNVDTNGDINISLTDLFPDATDLKPSESNNFFIGSYRQRDVSIPTAMVINNLIADAQGTPVSKGQFLVSANDGIFERVSKGNDTWGDWQPYTEALTDSEIDAAIAAAK